MEDREFILWVTLPPGVNDLNLLEKAAGLAEPLLDLRYGSEYYTESILKRAIHKGFGGLTIFVDYRKKDLINLLLKTLPSASRVILSSVEWDKDIALLLAEFSKRDIVTAIEVDNKNNARQAIAAGVDFLVASGNEACGWVSPKTSLILIQELLEIHDVPLVIRGSLGPQGVAGAMAAGCAGSILDSQLLLTDDSTVNDRLKKALVAFSPSDTRVVGDLVNQHYRLLCVGIQKEFQSLLDLEKKLLFEESSPQEKEQFFNDFIDYVMLKGFSEETALLPVGEGIAFAQQFAEEHLGIREVLEAYWSALFNSIARVRTTFPLSADSSLAKYHKVKYPIVQGPMAYITGNSKLALEVARAGALPFVAAGGLSPEETRQLLIETRFSLGKQPFGAGIIGFSHLEKLSEQVEAILAEPPDYVTITGGDTDLVYRFEKAGIATYIHAASLTHVKNYLDKQIKGIILEGHEAGGHVGALGSLVLWELGIREIMARDDNSTDSIRLLLAGGIANAQAALIAAVVASPLLDKHVALGIQIGTAYLMTDEAVKSGAIPAMYRNMLLDGHETVLVGKSVNLPSRWLATPAIHKMIKMEFQWEKDKLPLAERKKRVTKLDFDQLRSALINPISITDNTKHESSPLHEAYMCGQIISVQNRSRRIIELHDELTSGAQKLIESCSVPVAHREIPEDAIAIIGMGCIFPNARNVAEYWGNIVNRVNSIREVPKDRWNPDLYYDPDLSTPDKTHSKIGAFIDGFKKDPLKFRIPPISAPYIDNVQFIALEVAYQALDDAGYIRKNFPRERTGVYIGCDGVGDLRVAYILRAHWSAFANALKSVEEFKNLPGTMKNNVLRQSEVVFKQEIPEFSEDTCGGVFQSIVAGRICNCFDLGGPGLVIDGACASSIATIDAGVTALREGLLDMVLAGGIDTHVDAATYIFFSSLEGAISAKGSFPFDERADGFVLGEGAGMVLLKRLKDAIRDGDKIYAIIRSLGSSSDGRVKGITAPSAKGQLRAFERAYEKVPFTPDTVSLIEAHGTGTWNGDMVEITSLTEFIRQYSGRKKFVGLGSVKSMIGHLKCAAGIAGLIKVALALHNRVLPPTINCEQPRKDVDWENTPLYLITEPRQWEACHIPRRAGVNSFGFGGINFHAVLEEAPCVVAPLAASNNMVKGGAVFPPELLVFKTSTRDELLLLLKNTKDELIGASRTDLRKIAAELLKNMAPIGPTLAIVVDDMDKLPFHLDKASTVLNDNSRTEFNSAQGIYFSEMSLRQDEKIAFLFPGQGSQYAGMGGDLPSYLHFVGEIFRQVDTISLKYNKASIMPLLLPIEENSPEKKKDLDEMLVRPDCNHPAMLGIAMAILEVLSRAGIKPDMVAGHSLGEYIALYAAGVFDMETAIDVATVRGCGIAQHCFLNGAMASVDTPEEILRDLFAEAPGFVTVANRNCPAQSVISGDIKAVEWVVTRLQAEGFLCTRLPVTSAYHTPLLSPCAESFRDFLEKFTIHSPKVPVQSNLRGRAYHVDDNFATCLRDTLVKHMTQPVEFINNIHSMYEDGARLFIEVGPGSTLCSFVDNILAEKPHWTMPTNLPRRSATLQLLHTLAFCISHGIQVNLHSIMSALHGKRLLRQTTIPVAPTRRKFTAVTKSQVGGIPDLISTALADQNTEVQEQYLKQRGGFLKDMVRLDFKHFMGVSAAYGEAKGNVDNNLERQIVELVSQKTGYPPAVIDIDLDVEAELGIDSIKQVEIIRQLATKLGIDFGSDARSQRYRLTTLRTLIETCKSLISQKSVVNKTEPEKQRVEGKRLRESWNTDCHRWVCEKVETPLLAESDLQILRDKHVLLMARKDWMGTQLKSRLEAAGAIVSMVSMHDQPQELPQDYDIVLDLWSYMEDEFPSIELGREWWKESVQQALAVLSIAQNIISSIRVNGNRRALWVEVTSLGGELGARGTIQAPARAGIGLGMSRCLVRELPNTVESLHIDFDYPEPEMAVVDRILNELIQSRHSSEVGYTQGKRFEIRWKIDDAINKQREFRLDSQSVVIAVGGARGITASICHELAKRSGAQFVIIGKSPFAMDNAQARDPITFQAARDIVMEEWRAEGKRIIPKTIDQLAWKRVWEIERFRNMDSLRSVASNVAYYACDITDIENTRRLIKDIWHDYGRIDLIIQGGGTLIDKSIEEFDPAEFVDGIKSKALGTACLLAALSDVKVGTFINLSSISGRWGNIGQCSYAIGHEIASILVASANGRRSGRWFNIHYGPWLNVGITRIGDIIERLQARDSEFVTEKAGSDFFVEEFESNTSQSVAFFGRNALVLSVNAEDTSIATSSRTPLLDHVDIIAPGVAEGRRVFNLKRDRFVSEHYNEYEYPIIPGVVSLEMLAQTAFVLVNQRLSVTDLEDVTFPHAAIFPRGEPREFRSRMRLLTNDDDGVWFAGEVFSLFTPPGSAEIHEVIHARCRIRFGSREAPQRPSLLLVSTGIGDYYIDARPLWETETLAFKYCVGMFRNIHSFYSVTSDGVVGKSFGARVKEFGEHPFLDNPLLLDGFVHLVSLSTFAFHQFSPSFIEGIQSIKFFAADELGELGLCRIRIRDISKARLIYDVEAIDNANKVVQRITGVRRLIADRNDAHNLHEPIWDSIRENPQQVDIRSLLGSNEKLALAHVRISLVDSALEADGEELLHEQLSKEEVKRCLGFTHHKRRLEWLAGRIVAKGAIRIYFGSNAPLPSAIEIKSSPDNSPHIFIKSEVADSTPLYISISHCSDMAVAVASHRPGVGIDVEEINESILEISDEFSTNDEIDRVSNCTGFNRLLALVSLWVVKEAARKALGTATYLMKELAVQETRKAGEYIVFEIHHTIAGYLRAVAFRDGKYFYAVSLCSEVGKE